MDTIYADLRDLYAAAQSAQYGRKDLGEALELYRGIVSTHPDSQEARFSRTQIEAIVKSVVPELENLNAQIAVALTYLRRNDGETVDVEELPLTSPLPA